MLSASPDTLSTLVSEGLVKEGVETTFWELTALFKVAKSEFGSTVPRKIDLNWFIPALVNSKVGSDSGTTGDEATARATVLVATISKAIA